MARKTAAEKAAEKDSAKANAKAAADALKAEKADGEKPVYRVDRGEGIPTPPIKTATDKK